MALLVVLMLPTLWFALRSYHSFQLLRSAYAAGAPETSSVRPWMTLSYVGQTYHVSVSALLQSLQLPPNLGPNVSLRRLAKQADLSPLAYVQRVQRAVAALLGSTSAPSSAEASGWFAELSDEVLSALLVYGYPILGLILLIGTIGMPLPDGIATAVAGSLAAQGRMNWLAAGAIVVAASVVGDALGYGIGRLIGWEFLGRYGRWIGYTPARGSHVQRLFARWGFLTLLVTRTFVSYLSSAANLLAGVSRYPLSRFFMATLVGRLAWTAAYLGLGYLIGADLDAATGFLTNLSVFLLLVILVMGAGLTAALSGRRPQWRAGYTMS